MSNKYESKLALVTGPKIQLNGTDQNKHATLNFSGSYITVIEDTTNGKNNIIFTTGDSIDALSASLTDVTNDYTLLSGTFVTVSSSYSLLSGTFVTVSSSVPAVATANPQTVNAVGQSVGVSTKYAREDHNHNVSAGSVSDIKAVNATGSAGSLNSFARADHRHPRYNNFETYGSTTKTLSNDDDGKLIRVYVGTTITIPTGLSNGLDVSFLNDSDYPYQNVVTGSSTSVTILTRRLPRDQGPGSVINLKHHGSNVWQLSGDTSDGIYGIEGPGTNSTYYETPTDTPVGLVASESFYFQGLVRLASPSAQQGFFGAGTSAVSGWLVYLTTSDTISFITYDSTSATTTATATLDAKHYGKIQLLTVAYSASDLKNRIYINGVKIAESTAGSNTYGYNTNSLDVMINPINKGGSFWRANNVMFAAAGGQNYIVTETELLTQWQKVRRCGAMIPIDTTHHWWDWSREPHIKTTINDQTTGGSPVNLIASGSSNWAAPLEHNSWG